MRRSTTLLLGAMLALPSGALAQETVTEATTDSVWDYLAQHYDTDGDGRITREHYPRSDDSFDNLDHNGDGVLTPDDYPSRSGHGMGGGMMRMMEERMAQGAVQEAFQADDVADELARSEVSKSFNEYDTNGDGHVDREEFQRGIEVREVPAPQGMMAMRLGDRTRFDVLLGVADTSEDERLSVDELLAYFDATDGNGDGYWTAGGRPPHMRSGEAGRREDEPDAGGDEQEDMGGPSEGTTAPDFTLDPLHGGEPVTLSSWAGKKPVALIFGSYT